MFVNRSLWKIFSTDDIGPMQYVKRYEGGALALRYYKGKGTLEVIRRGLESPICYVPHSKGSHKHKYYGKFYKFKTSDGKEFFTPVDLAVKHLPEELPEEFIFIDLAPRNSVIKLSNYLANLLSALGKKHFDRVTTVYDFGEDSLINNAEIYDNRANGNDRSPRIFSINRVRSNAYRLSFNYAPQAVNSMNFNMTITTVAEFDTAIFAIMQFTGLLNPFYGITDIITDLYDLTTESN